MGQYNKAILTAAGENLIAQALAGEIQLNITKAKTSNYIYPAGTDFKSLTNMQGIKQTVSDPVTTVYNDTMIQTRALFSNEEVASTYYIYNIGLYAMNGTEEVLFCIVTAETPDEMPQYNGVASTSYIYNIQNVVQDATELHIVVNPSGTATIQDVLERVDATGGDISETVIETLETIEDKYPVPAAGESVKRFFGKVLTFLKNIRPLTGDITLYVATTGSDTSGDGTSGSPFKTIQHAIDVVPKNLNGYTATITIAAGTYPEDVILSGFSSSGLVKILLSGDVVLSTITVRGSNILMTSTAIESHNIYVNSMFILEHANFHAWAFILWHLTGSRTDATISSGTAFSLAVARGSTAYISGTITISGNTGIGIFLQGVSQAYFSTLNGSGVTEGVHVENLSKFTCLYNNIVAVNKVMIVGGAMEIQTNGTQIIGPITSGLSCTWGTITGGYARHGNTAGTAIVTVTITVTLTTNLSAGSTYYINGFPTITGGSVVAVSVHDKKDLYYCQMNTNGTMQINMSNPITAGNYLVFSCTYLTNS